MRQPCLAGLFAGMLTIAACGGDSEQHAAVDPPAPVPIQDKTWSVPYGLAHDGEISRVAFNAEGPVAMAWWHVDASSAELGAPYTYTCTFRSRRWMKAAGWGPIETLLDPGPSNSHRCGSVDIQANAAGDVLVVVNPVSPMPPTLFRRLAGETTWRQPVTSMSGDANVRAFTVARLGDDGAVRQVDFQSIASDGGVAAQAYRYATRLWERSGVLLAGQTIDLSYLDPIQGQQPIYNSEVSIDPLGNVLAVYGVSNHLRWTSFRADSDTWSSPSVVTAPGESAGRTPPADWNPAFRLSRDPVDGRPWLLTIGAPPGEPRPVEVLARRFDPEFGWGASELMVIGNYLWGWDPGALATLPDGRTMLVTVDAATGSSVGLLERTWTPGAGWSSPRTITHGPYSGYAAQVALSASGDAVVAFRDCAQVPRIPLYDGSPGACLVKVARMRDFASPASVWSTPEIVSPAADPPNADSRNEFRIGVRDLGFLANGDAYLAWWRSATYSSDWELWLRTLSGDR